MVFLFLGMLPAWVVEMELILMERSGIEIAGMENTTQCRRGFFCRPAMGHAQIKFMEFISFKIFLK